MKIFAAVMSTLFMVSAFTVEKAPGSLSVQGQGRTETEKKSCCIFAHNFARLRILYEKMLKTSGTARGGGMVRHELNTADKFFRNLDRLAEPVNRRMRQFGKYHSG